MKRTTVLLSLLILSELIVGAAAISMFLRADTANAGGEWSAETVLGIEDGVVGDGESISPFADDLPAIAQLEPTLRSAMQDAARDAIAAGIDFVVTGGWRSAAYQQSLLEAAVIEYGSAEVAGEFVLPPEESRHVTGEAVDIGSWEADSWLALYGADYGLCQIYANEGWHFELATSPGGQCPEHLVDARG